MNDVAPTVRHAAGKWKIFLLRRLQSDGAGRYLQVFIISSLVLTSYGLLRPPEAQLTLEMSSSVRSSAQVFYNVGHSFNEADSKTRDVYSESLTSFQKLQFALPSGIVSAFRFDPLMTEGTVRVRNVKIVGPLGTILRIPASNILAYNQIDGLIRKGPEVTVSTTKGSNDSGVWFRLGNPVDLTSKYEIKQLFVLNFLLLVFLLGIFLSADLLVRPFQAGRSLLEYWRNKTEPIAKKLSIPGFIQFNSYAIWFYALIVLIAFLFVTLDINGSSADYYKVQFGLGHAEDPLFGTPKKIRGDEWVFETPAILNEALRLKPFSFNHAPMGDDSIALVANVPVRHISTLFRPQFWAFFLLPVTYAFSVYWQCKGLILILGVFTWLLLFTRSTMWAIAGSLWYFFSPFIQWDYSWQSCIPEMVGLICFSMVFWAFLSVGRNVLALTACGIAAATCSIDFAMCGYAPHMIPLIWVAVPFLISWCIAHRTVIFRREQAFTRILVLAGTALLIAVIGLSVFGDVRHAIIELGNTQYPGKRIASGGGLPLQGLTSHFFNWAETEDHYVPLLANICEASGFLWLAPVTLFAVSKVQLDRSGKSIFASLWLSFMFFLVWLVFPVPARIGTPFGMQLAFFNRSLPALGLVNVAIVALCLGSKQRLGRVFSRFELFFLSLGVFLSALVILLLTNQALSSFFTLQEVLLTTGFLTLLTVLILGRRRVAVALILVVSQAALFGAVNPIGRGLGVITSSHLFQFIQSNKQYLNGKWVVFSGDVAPSGFLIAAGCDVYTGLRVLPDVHHFPAFLRRGMRPEAFDRAGYLLANAVDLGTKSSFESPVFYASRLNVNPSDPLLKELDVHFVAYDHEPSPSTSTGLIPIARGPIDHLWLYRIPY